jgi:putative nucleotidyltransferase with HDIG domain
VRHAFKDLWNHSLRTAVAARKIARAQSLRTEETEECFLTGLLHDIGKLILAANAEEEYKMVFDLATKAKIPMEQAENGIFGSTHAQVGAYLLALWGLPDSVVRAVESHHSMDGPHETFSSGLAVHIAQCLDPTAPQRKSQLRMDILEQLDLAERIPDWEDAIRQDAE